MDEREFSQMYLQQWDAEKTFADEDAVRKGVSLGYSTSEIARTLDMRRSEVTSIRIRLDI